MGFSAQLAPSGLLRCFAIGFVEAFTFMVKASHLPSGDHDKFEGDFCNWEITAVSPLLIQRMCICCEPELLETNASLLLFGDQRGEEELFNPVKSGLWFFPLVETCQRFERWRSFMMSFELRT